MSIFQSKEFWSTKVGDHEEFDPHHFCIANIDNEEPHTEKIVVGSFNGFVRIYQPSRRTFRVEDLLFEMNLGNAIVQIEAGHFVANAREIFLCVLFFKKIAIYSFVNTGKSGMQSKLVGESHLARNACNMTIGGFGGVKNRDLICVQSIDGMLMIYDQDKLLCMCQINDFILPGPLAYHPVLDCFILQNSNLEVECYRYALIGAVYSNTSKENKTLQPEWTFNVGETATDIVCVQRGDKIYDLIVLAEQMMFVLTPKGTIKAQKRFDYIPSCICVYDNPRSPIGQGPDGLPPLHFIIGSTSHHLMVYQDFQLIWTAKTNFIAHGLKVSTFAGIKGLVTTLNDEGWLEVSYLGTSPPQVALTNEEKKEINYVKAQEEYVQILRQIDQRESNQAPEVTEKLNIHAQFMGMATQVGYFENADQYFRDSNGSVIYARYKISLSYTGNRAQNIVLNLNLPNNLWAAQTTYSIDDLKGGATPYNFELQLYALNDKYPSRTKFGIHMNYYNAGQGKNFVKDPRTAYSECDIPMLLQASVVPPIKQANFKITLQGSQDMPPLNKVFEEFIKYDREAAENLSNPNVASFQLPNGVDCTLLVAKTGSKFRVQSSQFEGLHFVTMMFVQKVNASYPNINFSFADSLPLSDFFITIDEHFNLRKSIREKHQNLEIKANEFRIIEKRMLTRFKDRNPSPMNNLDFLLQKSYQDIMELGNIIEEDQAKMEALSHRLHVAALFITFLLKKRFSLSDAFEEEIRNYLAGEVSSSNSDIGWEEITLNNLTYLTKFISSRGEMGNYKAPALQRLDDVEKLKKVITSFLDKVAKHGGHV